MPVTSTSARPSATRRTSPRSAASPAGPSRAFSATGRGGSRLSRISPTGTSRPAASGSADRTAGDDRPVPGLVLADGSGSVLRRSGAGQLRAVPLGRLAPDVDAPQQGEPDDPQARGTGHARAARVMVEAAHEADAGDIYIHIVGHGDADAATQAERPDR